jgi:hypothetical protein
MKAHTASEWLDLTADLLLFLSGLLLLIDFAPRDLFPSQRANRQAVAILRAQRNLLGDLPVGLSAQGQTPTEAISHDPQTVTALVALIKQQSDLAHTVDWSRAVGVGYSAISIPVAQNKLDAFHPLYVTMLPRPNTTAFELAPVGQLEDLDRWLSRWHQNSLTAAAAILLAIGFLLQLLTRITRWRHNEN